MEYQDVLAELGAGSAHPGGPAITDLWAKSVNWSDIHELLEIGCGTGRSLAHLCTRYNCVGTGVDIRKKMIEKAKSRVKALTLNGLRFVVADAEHLPFSDESYDLVFTESVNVFLTEPEKALREYWRVLKPGGTYIDVEMLVMQPVDESWRRGVEEVYGAKFVPDQRGWKQHYKNAGFSSVDVLTTRSVNPYDLGPYDGTYSDIDLASPGVYQKPHVLQVLQANSAWMETNSRPLGFGVFKSQK
ncbi:methyltransferase domain-containing protein [Alicyclobacillus mengziensis]|uniref:Methyltransferase domain-containing protein n=1 Tax=Alicyclobacillus mengziensis TaxID=2931921 RepID=A0A9X7VVL8_9BACL|nr:methyltransferase domain-containing protein [Alicyclobacillus mengziensis]QSO45757.1 methyltransferase domain-containing protein [Alicyclobacillus mengziensis]